jgi:hypothetical protein
LVWAEKQTTATDGVVELDLVTLPTSHGVLTGTGGTEEALLVPPQTELSSDSLFSLGDIIYVSAWVIFRSNK